MPLYEFYCGKWKKEVSMPVSSREREKGEASCPKCGSRELRPLVGTFYSKTSKKS